MRKNKTINVKTPLELLQEKSANAVGIIRSTIDNLKAANSEIDAEHANNVRKIAELESTNTSLDELKTGNARVIANFESLLN